MNSGFGIAALIVFFLSLGVPFVGNFITLVALLLVAVAAWQRNVVWPIAIASASAVKLFFLSPSWMIAMSQDGGYVVWTLLFLALPIGVLAVRRVGADGNAEETPVGLSPAARPRSPVTGEDVIDWDRIANKDDPDSLQEYLLRHPQGRFAELARLKLERMGVQPLAQGRLAASETEVFQPPERAEARVEPLQLPATIETAESVRLVADPDDSEGEPRRFPIAIWITLIILVIGGGGFASVVLMRELRQQGAERAAWESVSATDSAAIRAFLAGEPGQYRDEAEDALAQLEAQRSREANQANTIESLDRFLAEFPDGVHALAARGRLAELREVEQRQTRFGPSAVWTPQGGADLVCANDDCLTRQMEAAGALPEAIAFTNRTGGDGYMTAFYELGRVDVAEVMFPSRAGAGRAYVIVNGAPDLIWVENEFLVTRMDSHSTFRTLQRLYPDATGWPPHRFIGSEATMEGGQRLIFGLNITDGCRACAVIAHGELSFDFDTAGGYRGASPSSVAPPTP